MKNRCQIRSKAACKLLEHLFVIFCPASTFLLEFNNMPPNRKIGMHLHQINTTSDGNAGLRHQRADAGVKRRFGIGGGRNADGFIRFGRRQMCSDLRKCRHIIYLQYCALIQHCIDYPSLLFATYLIATHAIFYWVSGLNTHPRTRQQFKLESSAWRRELRMIICVNKFYK
jgi:hypothetical protein